MALETPGRSRAWTVLWRAFYAFLRLTDPLIRAAWALGMLGITVDLVVEGRRTGRRRSVLVGLLRADGRWYVGHPNGEAGWTRNLEAGGRAEVRFWRGQRIQVAAQRLSPGDERAGVIAATSRQQPFPGNVIYRLARRHVMAVGVYFRLTPEETLPDQPVGNPAVPLRR
jgi:hypothetical protein